MNFIPGRPTSAAAILASALLAATQVSAPVPRSIFTDPVHDSINPARSEVLHIPTAGTQINGLAYIAQGAKRHPTVILMHGLPGNEKNLDVAQAIRRAGWNVVTFNYRGSWGSPGEFRFAQVPQDADAVIAFVEDTANARRLNIDTNRIVLGGHSMGGWATVLTASHHPELIGAFLISAADMGRWYSVNRAETVAHMADDMESLAGVTAESMSDEIIANGERWQFDDARATELSHTPLLVLTSNDGLAAHAEEFVKAIRSHGNMRVTTFHCATDHSWNDSRIVLESKIVSWLQQLDK